MQNKWPWFERTFSFDFPPEKMPDILERLRGTSLQVEAIVKNLPNEMMERREKDDSWSIKENIGHLGDLEPLWAGRIEDILAGKETMRDADLTNQPTFDADHNSDGISTLISDFRDQRNQLVKAVVALDSRQWSLSALHPRLKTPMRIVDLCYFVAEHDDYHLARMRHLADQSN